MNKNNTNIELNISVFIKIRGDALCQLPKRLEGPNQDVQMKERIEEGLSNLDGYTNVMKDDALFPPDGDV